MAINMNTIEEWIAESNARNEEDLEPVYSLIFLLK